LYRTAGTSQIYVATAQAILFALVCVIVFAITRHVASDELAAVAALATAIFPPIPYFGALVMTEVWTTFLLTAAMWLAVRALDTRSAATFIALGVLCAVTTLSRPAFVLFPLTIAGLGLVLFPLISIRTALLPRQLMLMLATFAIVMSPWFAYNYRTIGRFTLSPAGGFGRGIWEGSWQAAWPGRLQAELTGLAEAVDDRAELDRKVTAVASREHLAAAPMLDYVHQWQDLHAIWAGPTDPYERTMARATADSEYFRVGLDNLKRDRLAHQALRVARGAFILWAGDIPFRYSDINRLPALVIRLCWLIQALIFALGMVGVIALGRRNPAAAWLLGAPIVYVTAVHVPLLTEARQSLPAKPVLLILATIGAAHLWKPRSRAALLAVEPQVHEGQHL